jgi:hypothetical protein
MIEILIDKNELACLIRLLKGEALVPAEKRELYSLTQQLTEIQGEVNNG